MLDSRMLLAQQRVQRGPPAFERYPELAFRYRDWGAQTRHARGDAYPLYTLDTLRNMADHLFDSATGYKAAPERAAKVKPCELLYSTLRPTSAFIARVHNHIKVPYLLMTDTADQASRPAAVGGWRQAESTAHSRQRPLTPPAHAARVPEPGDRARREDGGIASITEAAALVGCRQ